MVIGKELKAVGINMNYAPVVDVNTNTESPVIKNRAFSSDPEVCGRMGSAVCRGLQKMGVISVAKHFPGHGDTKKDSHLELPVVHKTLEELEARELVPFKRVIRSRVEAIMTAHILNPRLDSEYPATLSSKTITDILRKNLRFNRLIVSDDMEMKAITDRYDVKQAAVRAVSADCDILIYRGDAGLARQAMDAVVEAVQTGQLSVERLEQSNARIIAAKKAYAEQSSPIDVTEVSNYIGLPAHFKLADLITRKEKPADETADAAEFV
jgi:beta-N-acetylhexosaminidase